MTFIQSDINRNGTLNMKDAYNQAISLLQQASSGNGFLAAVQEEDNYKRVWTRDSALCGLAALSTGRDDLAGTYRRSLETILNHQHPNGFVPSNVTDDSAVSYGGVVGRVDNHAWIIISACNYAHVKKDQEWLLQFERHINRSIQLMQAWEFNGRGLMYVPQSADWADEYHHHGYILYNQLLRLWALRSAARMFERDDYAAEAERVQSAIETYFTGNGSYAVQTKRTMRDQHFAYWVMGFNPSAIYPQFDLQANALALLLNIGPVQKRASLLGYIQQLCNQTDLLLPSFYPAIERSDASYPELQRNFVYRFRNVPHEFHNGGLWPVWNGLASFALSRYMPELSQEICMRIKDACMQDNAEFNECYHGETNRPVGVKRCAWSAAGLILSVNSSFIDSLITQ